ETMVQNAIARGARVAAGGNLIGNRGEAYHQWIIDHQCLKRRIEDVDVANLAVFLSSPQADLISGQNIS
ncbi:3-ketoacyl-ACP reductase, partial [Rhizobium johnstonii]